MIDDWPSSRVWHLPLSLYFNYKVTTVSPVCLLQYIRSIWRATQSQTLILLSGERANRRSFYMQIKILQQQPSQGQSKPPRILRINAERDSKGFSVKQAFLYGQI